MPYYKKENVVQFVVYYACQVAVYLIAFYINYSILIPKFLFQKKYFHYLISLALLLILFHLGLIQSWGGYYSGQILPRNDQIESLIGATTQMLFVSAAFKFIDYWMESEKKKRELEIEVKQAELLFLKSQISPHFLFNTLNNIYGLALTESKNTGSAIAQLRNLMNYIDNFSTTSRTSIKNEILQMQNFIQLNLLRYSVKVNFNSNCTPEMESYLIESMLFLPFIENAFKHGNINNNAVIDINFSAKNNHIYFSVTNEINPNKRIDDVGGIGIANIKRRLELVYDKQFKIDIEKSESRYSTHLQIDLLEK